MHRKFPFSKPPQSDRLIGFTIPKDGAFFIGDHDEVWRVAIGEVPLVEETDLAPYAFVKERKDFLGLVFERLTANPPLLRVGGNDISYRFNPKKDVVNITCNISGRVEKIAFPILSGDWFAASFSVDGRHLVLAEPYDIALYEVG